MIKKGQIPFQEYDEKWSDWYFILPDSTEIVHKKKRRTSSVGVGVGSYIIYTMEHLISLSSEDLDSQNKHHWHLECIFTGASDPRWQIVSVKQGGLDKKVIDAVAKIVRDMSDGMVNISAVD